MCTPRLHALSYALIRKKRADLEAWACTCHCGTSAHPCPVMARTIAPTMLMQAPVGCWLLVVGCRFVVVVVVVVSDTSLRRRDACVSKSLR